MRYFMFNYSSDNGGNGNICASVNGDYFPSSIEIVNNIKLKHNLKCYIVIKNIFEFKNKKDYDDWTRE